MPDDKNTITRKEYWHEVTAMAKEAKKSAKGDDRDISDILHEMVDGHTWIIYTWAYPYVLIHSRHEDALFDDLGPTEATSYQEIMQKMAYWSLYQDVADEIG